MDLATLSITAWAALLAGGLLVGFAKTAINGAGALAVVLFTWALPARESTGTLLPLLIAGDLLAVALYRRHADWRTLLRLLPGVLPGLVLGWWFVGQMDDTAMRRTIAVILVMMTGLQLWQRHRNPLGAARGTSRPGSLGLATSGLGTSGLGAAAGFATMTANAAGPVTTLYLVRAGLPMLSMLGTAAWFYLLVNLGKVPFSASLDLISPQGLVLDAALVPALLVGGWLGVQLVRRIDQRRFEVAALLLGGASAALLLM